MSETGDWRDAVLDGMTWREPASDGRNPLGWPGYTPRPAVRWGEGRLGGHAVVACAWDFATYGGSFGEAEADALAAACGHAAAARVPLVTFLRTGGTRLQEGMAALVGIPRDVLALRDLARAGVPHIAVVDHPTTGGVWVGVGAAADVRCAVAGSTVGFSGPRVVEAMTGAPLAPGSHTAADAYAAGLVDAVVAGAEVADWVGRALRALAPDAPCTVGPPPVVAAPDRGGWAQVQAARDADRPAGGTLLDALLSDVVDLRGGDDTVRAVVGRIGGRRAVAVALASACGGRPTPAGFRLLRRAAALTDRLGAALVTLVDTPGADPGPASENAGLAHEIGAAMTAMLECHGPTVAVVHGEGGSGGALAAAVADRVLVTPTGYFAAMGPEGAATALRVSARDAADRMGVTPRDLLSLGFADAMAPGDPASLTAAVSAVVAELAAVSPSDRLAARERRWRAPLPGGPTASS